MSCATPWIRWSTSEVAALVDEGETVKTEPEQPTQEEESTATAEEEPEEEEGAKKTLVQIVNAMTPAQKICLAMKGNREARSILIRDSNKLVCTAVIRSPRSPSARSPRRRRCAAFTRR